MDTDFRFAPGTAFVTLLAAPPGDQAPWLGRLQALLRVDAYALTALVRRAPPVILGAAPPDEASRCVETIEGAGGRACLPSWQAMGALGNSEEVTAVEFGVDGLLCTLKSGRALVEHHQTLMVCHGVLKTRVRETRVVMTPVTRFLPLAADQTLETAEATVQDRHSRHEEVRLWLRSGRCLRVTRQCAFPRAWGDRVNWRVNLLRFVREFTAWDPSARLDHAFGSFIPPRDLKARLDKVKVTTDWDVATQTNVPAFEFYTRWRFCLEDPSWGAR